MYRDKSDRQKIERALNYQFKDENLLLQALTRRSALNEGRQKHTIGDFQRLEFIGDKVLNLVVSDILFENNPTWDEGHLTTEVSRFVNNKGPLTHIAQRLNLGDYLIMGAGEEKENKGRENQKILSDAFEALLGALWLDSGKDFSFMRNFLLKQYKALGLTDFNRDYEQAVVTMGIRAIADDLMERMMPEIYDAERGDHGLMTITQIIEQRNLKDRATKPLTGLAAILERFASGSGSEDDSETEVPTPSMQALSIHTSEKKTVLPSVAALTAQGMGVGITPAKQLEEIRSNDALPMTVTSTTNSPSISSS